MSINVGTAMGYLDLDTTKFKKGIQTALKDLKDFESSSSSVGTKLTAVGSAMTTIGSTLTKSVTVPIAGIGVAATSMAITFESKMSEVKAISGATASEFDALNKKAIEMGAKTKFSASESAEAFKYMAMAGWDATSMLDGISGIMDLAAASGEDLATVSDIVTDSLTAFGLQASDSAHFADVLAQASSKSNTNVALMGETFKYVAPVAGALGYSIEDTAVAIGLMANSGIKASQAGTSLRSIITNLTRPVGQAEEAITELGISITNTDGTMKPLSQTMLELREKFSGMTEAQKAQYAAMLAGQEGMSGFLAIVNASESDFQKLTNEINNANGAAQKMADIMMDNTAGAVEQLKGSLESAGIIIGNKLTPYIRGLAEWIGGLVEKFNSLSAETQDLIVRIGLFVAAIGPSLLIIGNLVKMAGALVTAFTTVKTAIGLISGSLAEGSIAATALAKVLTTIGKLFNPITAVVAVLVAAFKTLWSTNEEFRDSMTQIWSSMVLSVQEFIDGVTSRLSSLEIDFQSITETLKSIWQGFCSVLAPIFEGAFSMIAEILDTVLGVITGFIDILIGIFTRDWNTLWQGVQEVFGSVWSGLTGLIEIFIATISNLVNVVLGFFGTSWQEIWQSVLDFFTSIWSSIINFINVTIPQAIQNILAWFENLPYNIGVFLGNVYLLFLSLGENIISWVTGTLPGIINSIVSWFAQLPGMIWSWLLNVISNVISFGANLLSAGVSAASNFVNSFINLIQSLPDKVWSIISQIPGKIMQIGNLLYQAGASIFTQLWNGIKSIGNSILGWVSDFAGSISNFVSSIVQGFTDVVSGANNAKAAAMSVDGSHKNGLSYVPFDGYIAELHQGEKVLTKEEAKAYDSGRAPTSSGDTYNFYSTIPTPYEYARKIKKAKQELLNGF